MSGGESEAAVTSSGRFFAVLMVAVGLATLVLLWVAVLSPMFSPKGGAPTKDKPAAVSRCSPASPALVDTVAEGLTVTGGGSLKGAYVVKSNDFNKAYFVAANIVGQGLSGQDTGVWVTNSESGQGSVYAVNAFAKEFSDRGDGGQTDAGFSMNDDGAREVEACAKSG